LNDELAETITTDQKITLEVLAGETERLIQRCPSCISSGATVSGHQEVSITTLPMGPKKIWGFGWILSVYLAIGADKQLRVA
jgi:hypothetical protein